MPQPPAVPVSTPAPASAPVPVPAPETTPVPQAHPLTRYQSVWENSPFELEAPPTANTAAGSPLSEEFALVGITKVKGKTVVTLLDKKAGTSFDLREDQPRNAVKLLGVALNKDPMLTEVKLAKGAVTGSVGYDKKSMAAAPKRPPQTVVQAGPGAPQQSVLNRSPSNPNPGAPPTHAVARRRILTPTIPPPQSPTQPTLPGMSPNPAMPGQPEIPQPRTSPTPNDRRQIVIPQPLPQ